MATCFGSIPDALNSCCIRRSLSVCGVDQLLTIVCFGYEQRFSSGRNYLFPLVYPSPLNIRNNAEHSGNNARQFCSPFFGDICENGCLQSICGVSSRVLLLNSTKHCYGSPRFPFCTASLLPLASIAKQQQTNFQEWSFASFFRWVRTLRATRRKAVECPTCCSPVPPRRVWL